MYLNEMRSEWRRFCIIGLQRGVLGSGVSVLGDWVLGRRKRLRNEMPFAAQYSAVAVM